MRCLIAVAIGAVVLTTVGADAQVAGGMGGGGHKGSRPHSADKTGPTKPKADESAYRAALKSVPDKPYDPWQNAR